MPRDHQLFVGGDHPGCDAARRAAYLRSAARAGVGVGLERETEPGGVGADPRAQARTVLADAGGEYDRIEATERRGERAELAADAIGVKIDRRLRARRVARFQRAHVARYARHAEQAGLLVDQLLDRARIHAELVDQIQDDAGIEAAAARAHRQAIDRGEAHRARDAAPSRHRAHA